MKTNFSAKVAKGLRVASANEGKGMNHCIKAVLAVWNREPNDDELKASIQAAKADGITADDFSAEFVKAHLAGTKWISEDGKMILTNKKGEMVAKCTWTPSQVVDYVRRANKARLEKIAKENEAK